MTRRSPSSIGRGLSSTASTTENVTAPAVMPMASTPATIAACEGARRRARERIADDEVGRPQPAKHGRAAAPLLISRGLPSDETAKRLVPIPAAGAGTAVPLHAVVELLFEVANRELAVFSGQPQTQNPEGQTRRLPAVASAKAGHQMSPNPSTICPNARQA